MRSLSLTTCRRVERAEGAEERYVLQTIPPCLRISKRSASEKERSRKCSSVALAQGRDTEERRQSTNSEKGRRAEGFPPRITGIAPWRRDSCSLSWKAEEEPPGGAGMRAKTDDDSTLARSSSAPQRSQSPGKRGSGDTSAAGLQLTSTKASSSVTSVLTALRLATAASSGGDKLSLGPSLAPWKLTRYLRRTGRKDSASCQGSLESVSGTFSVGRVRSKSGRRMPFGQVGWATIALGKNNYKAFSLNLNGLT